MLRRSLLALAFVAALPALALDLPNENEKWNTLKADELTVYSNASAPATLKVARQLLQMRAALGKLTRLKVRSPLPTQIYVFANEKSFAPYRDALFHQKANGTTGVFFSSADANVILVQADAAAGIDRVIYHELTHYFVNNTLPSLPLWFDEGLAEYYSTFVASGDDIALGRPVPEHVLWLREPKLIPLRELFATDTESPNYNERARQGVFYAESWALVHYLMLGNPQRHGQLETFLALLNEHKPLDDAFRGAFNVSYDELERELLAYVRRLSFQYMKYSGADLHTPELPQPTEMPRATVLYALGDLLASSGPENAPDSERFLLEAVKLDPKLAAAHADLGRIYVATGRDADATAAFERATATGSEDPNVYLYAGGAILEKAKGHLDPASAKKARELFTRAAELKPSAARAWAGLGATYAMTEGDPTPGIAPLEKSLSLGPGQLDVLMNLLQLYARTGRRDDIAQVIETTVAPMGNKELLARATDLLAWSDAQRIGKLLEAGKEKEAVALAKDVLGRTNDPDIKVHLQELVDSLEGARANGAALEQAMQKANEGKFDEALAIVDATLPRITDADTKEAAERFRDDILAAKKRKKK